MIFSLKNNVKPIDKINKIGFVNRTMPFNYLKIPNLNNDPPVNKTFFSMDNKIREKYKNVYEINNKDEINNEDKYYKIIYPPSNNIKKIFIFTTLYTTVFANNLKEYFNTLNIESTIYEKVMTDEIINMCVNDPNLYLFIICPQKIFKNYIGNIPQNKYIIYQTEQYNQACIPKINDILLENALCVFDYSENNLNYFNNIIKEKIHILSPLIDKKIIYSTTKKDIDILFVGSLNERRKTIINKIREYIEKNNLNYKFTNVEKTFGDDLYRIIKRSKCVINLHYYQNSLFEVFRIHDMLNYDCKIISEKPEMQEELYLIDKYKKIIDFFPIIKDDFSNIDFLYEVIEKNLKNRSNISEREKYEFIKSINSESENILDNNILYNNIINNSIDKINDKNDFRNICNLNLGIIKNVLIPNIQLNKEYETFYIEFRKFRHSEFLIRNIIIKLPEWSHTVICGNLNFEFMQNICNRISENIKIIKLNIDNLNTAEYSRLLMSKEFWNNFNGEKLLLYQEDSYMFHNRIDEFLKYDYVGAPWPIHQDEHINQKEYGVGNGGFSLRSKSKMIEVINKVNWEKNLKLGPMLTQYMKNTNNYIIPEDVYFSKSLLEKNIGKVATRNVAINFSQETQKSPDPLGGHNFFLADNNKIFGLIKKTRKVAIFTHIPYTLGGGEYYISKIIEFYTRLNYQIYYYNNTNHNLFIKTKNFYIDRKYHHLIFQKNVQDIKFIKEYEFDYFIEMGNTKAPTITNHKFAYKNIFHSQFPYDYKSEWNISNINFLDCIIVNSEFTHKYYKQCSNNKLDSNKIKILYPLCFEKLNNGLIRKSENTFIMIGRIFPYNYGENNKNYTFIIDIFKKFSNKLYTLFIIGSCKNQEYLNYLIQLTKSTNIHILPDIDDDKKYSLLSQCKYFIHATGADNKFGEIPSSEEHFGISTIEAMSNGCLPICANRGFPPFYIKHKENGLLFDNFSHLYLLIEDLIVNKKILYNNNFIEINNKIIDKFSKSSYISNLSNILLNI